MTGWRRAARRAAAAPCLLGAIAAAWPGTPARAQAGRLELYGIADAALAYSRNGEGASRASVRSGQASTSRFGLRGREPLGGDLELQFQLEAGIDLDDGRGGGEGGALSWNRQSWVGLAGRFGTLTVGRQYRPQTRAVFVMDPFDGSSFASPPNTYSNMVFRSDDAIVYETPRIAGLQALLMAAPGEARGEAGDGRGAALLYRRGPLQLAYGWDRRVNREATDARVWHSLGGSYAFDAATLYVAYRARKEDAAALDERSYWVGASMPLGAFTLRGTLGAVEDRSAQREGTTGLGLGVEYPLSRRAELYGRYAALRNRNGAGFDLDDGIEGRAPQSLALGLRMSF